MTTMIFGVWQIGGKNVHFPAVEKGTLVQDIPPRRRKRLMVLRSKLNPYNLPMLNEIIEQARAKGLELHDLYGKRLSVKIKVGKRYKIKSFRLYEAKYIPMCSCCGLSPWMHYRFEGKECNSLDGLVKKAI